jgi:serine/threonine protein kinase
MINRSWEEIEEVYYRILDMPENTRADALNALRETDSDLAEEVESLLNLSDAVLGPDRNPVVNLNNLARLVAAAKGAAHQPQFQPLLSYYLHVPAFEPNAKLNEFRLERFLGNGAFGAVWLAEHETAVRNEPRWVALKFPECQSEELSEELLGEARRLALLDHPNIVKLLRTGRTDGMIFLCMEYVPHGHLSLAGSRKARLFVSLFRFSTLWTTCTPTELYTGTSNLRISCSTIKEMQN